MKAQNVPIILQMEALECGAASLAMILAYYKRYVPLERLRIDCGVSRDGSKAKDILVAARHHGLVAKGYKYSVEKLKSGIKLPAIIHWNFNHFVVLVGFKKGKAIVNDPASGRIEVPMEVFDKSYTGITMIFEKGENFQEEGKPKSIMGFLLKHLIGYKNVLFFIILVGLMLSFINITIPVFTKIFTDYILLGQSSEWMSALVSAMAITLIVTFVLNALQESILLKLKGKMTASLSTEFIWHVLRLPVEFFSQRSVGDISDRQNNNSEVAKIFCEKLAPIFINVVMIIFYFCILLYYDIIMAIIALLMVILNVLFVKLISKKNMNDNKNKMRDNGKVVGAAMSGISMMETIKASGAENGYFEKISGYQAKYNNSVNRLKKRNLYLAIVPTLLTELCNTAILILGIYNILKGNFTIGMLLAFQGFLSAFITPVNELVEAFEDIQTMSGKMDRIDDVIEYSTDIEIDFSISDSENEYKKLKGDIELKEITFGYSPLTTPLIENFSLKVEQGQMVALVGGSGSGKSTIAKLISGLYKIRSGEILYDGKRREDTDRYVITNSLSVVDQNITIFKDTIRNNVTLWNDDIDDVTVTEACKDACIHDDIMSRAGGYDYMMSEGGKNFSGGQRQRIEIARAFISNPSIIILDEATSALDPMTEQKIMESIKRRGITCFIIAHRLSTIRDADEIIMLKYGKEVERGTHEQLIHIENGHYAKLVKSE